MTGRLAVPVGTSFQTGDGKITSAEHLDAAFSKPNDVSDTVIIAPKKSPTSPVVDESICLPLDLSNEKPSIVSESPSLKTKQSVLGTVRSLSPQNHTVAIGGSVTDKITTERVSAVNHEFTQNLELETNVVSAQSLSVAVHPTLLNRKRRYLSAPECLQASPWKRSKSSKENQSLSSSISIFPKVLSVDLDEHLRIPLG